MSRLVRAIIKRNRQPPPLNRVPTICIDEPSFGGKLNAIIAAYNAARLKQIQANLLTNASKYSAPGESIHLSIEREEEWAVIRVRDTGVGIAADMLQSIFEMFVQSEETLDRSQGGMGLGLTLSVLW